MIKMVKCYRSS